MLALTQDPIPPSYSLSAKSKLPRFLYSTFSSSISHHPVIMLDSFFLRSGSEELAKAIHSLSGAVTTIFLFTRIWARTSLYKGLWWDDYICRLTIPVPEVFDCNKVW